MLPCIYQGKVDHKDQRECYAQDALTSALISNVQSQRDHAVAIAALRFQSGRLMDGDRDAFLVPVADLVTPP